LQIFIPLSIRQLCKLCSIWRTVLPQILAYALLFLFSVFPSLIFHFPVLKSFQSIHLSPNHAVIFFNILVFCHPTLNIEIHPFLAVCHYLLIIFASTLHIWRLSPTSAAWWSAVLCCQGGDNCWWFVEAALKFSRKMGICFRSSNVTCEMALNVKCDSTSSGGTFNPRLWQVLLCCLHFFVPWSWRLQVCPRVSYSLPCYMGHICGLQCYHFRRVCAVLTVQKKAVDNFVVAQGSWKADIRSSSQEVPSFNGKWTFLPELKNACHCGPLWHHTMLFF